MSESIPYTPMHALSQGLQRGEYSSEEITRTFLDRIAEIGPRVNAYISVQEEAALDMARAAAIIGPISWCDRAHGKVKARPETFGDVVLARKDTPTSYHLAVTVDDHLQGVSVVCRGADLLEATHIHRLLQALLGYDTPQYQHHRLLTDDAGRRLAKRQDSLSIRALREHGYTPEEVRAMTGFDG